jgi:fructose-1,6-bisphosphatase/inositol monophosphatase family enzyme
MGERGWLILTDVVVVRPILNHWHDTRTRTRYALTEMSDKDLKINREAILSEVASFIELGVLDAARYLDHASSSGAELKVEVKADKTLVMNLDMESQRLILRRLASAGYPIVAEEDPASHQLINSEGSYLLVDPLDGTTSCKRFLGQFGGHVGFGPLVGFVHEGELAISYFYSVPYRKLFRAIAGQGVEMLEYNSDFIQTGAPIKLVATPCPDLGQAGMLFFISHQGEAAVVEYLRKRNAIENIYRFGGFANDSARLAQSFEQIQLQFLVKPWDFTAVLIAKEAGCEVFCDPMKRRVPLADWRMEANNPVVVLPAGTSRGFFALLDQMKD